METLAQGKEGQAEKPSVPRGLHVLGQGWPALAVSTHRSCEIGTEGNNKPAENLKIPLYIKYHCNANVVVRCWLMDL